MTYECPAPQPMLMTFDPTASTRCGSGTFVSSPVPQIPCSFQPQLYRLPSSEIVEKRLKIEAM